MLLFSLVRSCKAARSVGVTAATEAWRRLSLACLWKAETQESVTEMEFWIAVAIPIRHSLTAAIDSIAAERNSFEKPGGEVWPVVPEPDADEGTVRVIWLSLKATVPFAI